MKGYSAILVCIPHHTNMTSAPTVSTLSSTGDHWTPRRTSNYNNDELGPSDEPRKRPSRPTSCFSNALFCCIGFLFYFYHYERLVLLHRFPLLFFTISRCGFWHLPSAAEVEPLKNIFLSPLRYHQSPHVCSHILRGGTFLLFSCRALFRNKSDTTELDTGPNTEESKPEGRLTRGRACRKLGGAGSTPKNTSIVETLRDFSIAYRHHPVKQQRARMSCRS